MKFEFGDVEGVGVGERRVEGFGVCRYVRNGEGVWRAVDMFEMGEGAFLDLKGVKLA